MIGPECTGKTTLARRLAEHLGRPWAPEFAREYAEPRRNALTAADVEPIARGQMRNEDAAGVPVVKDTDLVSTVVYARHYYGDCAAWIEEEARSRRADLYLLMDTDIEWVPDAARDTPGEGREDLFDAFRVALEALDARFVIVSGVGEERFRNAVKAIDDER